MNGSRSHRGVRLMVTAALTTVGIAMGAGAASAAAPPAPPVDAVADVMAGGVAGGEAGGRLPETGTANNDVVAGIGLSLMLTGTCLLLAIRRPH